MIGLGGVGVAYEPSADVWWELPPAPEGVAFRGAVPVIWAEDRVLIWSGVRGESSTPSTMA